MAYFAKWLKGTAIVAEEEFEGLLEAQASVLACMTDYQNRLGADSVEVWDGGAVCFQFDMAKPQQ